MKSILINHLISSVYANALILTGLQLPILLNSSKAIAAVVVNNVVLTGPTKINKNSTGNYSFTVTGTSTGGLFGDYNWSVFDEDPLSDDELIPEQREVITAAGPFAITRNFQLKCDDCTVKGIKPGTKPPQIGGSSGEGSPGDPAEVYVLIESVFLGQNLGSSNILDVICMEPMKRQSRAGHWSGDLSKQAQISFNNNSLSFSNMSVTPTLKLSNDQPSINDPLEGAEIIIGDTQLLGGDSSNGWFFTSTTFQYVSNGITVLTAEITDPFLFIGGGGSPEFDSELQGSLGNISINNVINSPYLQNLERYTTQGSESLFSFYSDILTETDNLLNNGISQGEVSADGKKVPEPTSTLSLLALGTLGAASTLKRKLKSSQSTEKETTKVG